MNHDYVIRLDRISYDLLTEVFDEALESENISVKTKRDFSNLLNDIRLQAKQPVKTLVLHPKETRILSAVLSEKITRMQHNLSRQAEITPGIKKLFADSEQHMSNLITQLSHE